HGDRRRPPARGMEGPAMSGYRKLDLDAEMNQCGVPPAKPAKVAKDMDEVSSMSDLRTGVSFRTHASKASDVTPSCRHSEPHDVENSWANPRRRNTPGRPQARSQCLVCCICGAPFSRPTLGCVTAPSKRGSPALRARPPIA